MGRLLTKLQARDRSLPVALATLAFYVGYRLAEDYLIEATHWLNWYF